MEIQEQGAAPQADAGVEVKKRFALHVLETVSGKHYSKVMAVLKSTDNLQEGLAKALYMLIEVADKKMQKEGVTVPPELYVGGEGLLAASMMILLKVITKDGVKPSKEDIQQAIEQVSKLVTQRMEGGQAAAPQPQQAQPQQAPQPQPQQPQQPPQGLLTQGGV